MESIYAICNNYWVLFRMWTKSTEFIEDLFYKQLQMLENIPPHGPDKRNLYLSFQNYNLCKRTNLITDLFNCSKLIIPALM